MIKLIQASVIECFKFLKIRLIGAIAILALGGMQVSYASLSQSDFYNHPSVDKAAMARFVDKLSTEYGIDRQRLEADLSTLNFRQDIIDLMNKPPEKTRTWPDYKDIFLQSERIQEGVDFIRQYEGELVRAEQQYGVPVNVIVAIIGVETKYGGNKGSTPVFDALGTIAFGYPKRSHYFTSELEHYLRYLRYEDPSLFTSDRVGSYAGAMGIPQFMPSSYHNHAVDFDGDGRRDLFDNPIDAIGSVANYLSHFGWKSGQPVFVSLSDQDKTILRAEGFTDAKMPAERFINRGIAVAGLSKVPPSQTVRVIKYDMGNGGTDYKLALHNYDVIQRYNQYDYYVTVVTLLANEIAAQYHQS